MGERTEWFNSPDWGPRAQAEFERKLARARNKDQYLYAKGGALIEAGDPERRQAGRDLLLRLVQEHPDMLQIAFVHETVADTFAEDGLHEEAERQYREALAAYERVPSVRGHAHVRLAELITGTQQRDKYAEAEALLDDYEPVFKLDYFRVHTVRTRLAAKRGDYGEASTHARAALAVTADPKPQFTRHPGVGDVRADPETMAELKRLAGRPTGRRLGRPR